MKIVNIQTASSFGKDRFSMEVFALVIEEQEKGNIVHVDYKPLVLADGKILYTAMIVAKEM